MVYQSPCHSCKYNYFEVDEMGDCKEDKCQCPKEELHEKRWLEKWARAEQLKEDKNER